MLAKDFLLRVWMSSPCCAVSHMRIEDKTLVADTQELTCRSIDYASFVHSCSLSTTASLMSVMAKYYPLRVGEIDVVGSDSALNYTPI